MFTTIPLQLVSVYRFTACAGVPIVVSAVEASVGAEHGTVVVVVVVVVVGWPHLWPGGRVVVQVVVVVGWCRPCPSALIGGAKTASSAMLATPVSAIMRSFISFHAPNGYTV